MTLNTDHLFDSSFDALHAMREAIDAELQRRREADANRRHREETVKLVSQARKVIEKQ